MVARVRLHGSVIPHGDPTDKYAASNRVGLSDYHDADDVLRAFACRCALDVAHRWDPPTVVMQYLQGDDTARAAARGAARAAARAAAWAAAWVAARAAARGAAWVAARAAQNERLHVMLMQLVGLEGGAPDGLAYPRARQRRGEGPARGQPSDER